VSDGQLRVEPAVLRATCHSLSGAADHLQAVLRSLDGTVTGMVGDWQGPSGGAYGDAWTQWHQGAGEVEKALSILARLLDATAKGFESHEQDGAQKLRSVSGG
jgi:WXG100 family type VII secretion target